MSTLDTRFVARQATTALLTEALAPLGVRPCIRQSRRLRTRRWMVFWTRDDKPDRHRHLIMPAFWILTHQGTSLTWETVTDTGRRTARFQWNAGWMTWDLIEGAESLETWFEAARGGWAAWLKRVPPPVPSDFVPPWSRRGRGIWAGLVIVGMGLIITGLWQQITTALLYGILFEVFAFIGLVERVDAHRWRPIVWVPDSVPSITDPQVAVALPAITAAWAMADSERPRAQLWTELQDALRLELYADDLRLHRHDSEWSISWNTNLPHRHAQLLPEIIVDWIDPHTVRLFFDRQNAHYNAAHDAWEFEFHVRQLHWSGTDWRSKTGEPWHLMIWPEMMAHLTTWPRIHEPTPTERQERQRYQRQTWIASLAGIGGCAVVGALIVAASPVDGAIGGVFVAMLFIINFRWGGTHIE